MPLSARGAAPSLDRAKHGSFFCALGRSESQGLTKRGWSVLRFRIGITIWGARVLPDTLEVNEPRPRTRAQPREVLLGREASTERVTSRGRMQRERGLFPGADRAIRADPDAPVFRIRPGTARQAAISGLARLRSQGRSPGKNPPALPLWAARDGLGLGDTTPVQSARTSHLLERV